MKDELDSAQKTTGVNVVKKEGLFGKTRYKFWVLAAILLLAFWSMFTGSVTLKWTAGNLSPLSDDFDSLLHDDLDVLDVEEREKVVRHMWDVYTHSSGSGSSKIRLPRFWQEAFEAAYEDLTSDFPAARGSAVSEIAKMSLRSILLDPPPLLPKSTEKRKKNSKPAEEDKKAQ